MADKDKREYDYEGDMAMSQLRSIIRNSQLMHDKLIEPNTNLPEWVQAKITLAKDYIETAANYLQSELDEDYIEESSNSALIKKSKASGVSLSTLKTVYKRGVAAWNSGHRPGTTPQQWGMARVNSYITKGKGTYHGADKDLREEDLDEACWDSYKQVGMKKKNGKMVPDCVPKEQVDEEIKLNTKVRIHAPGKDYHNEVGRVGEIRHGLYKGAPKTYTVDYGNGRSIQLQKNNVKVHKEQLEEDSRMNKDVYHTGLSKSTREARVRHWQNADNKSDRDPDAYKPAPGDKEAKTKPSEHTIKYRKMYGEEKENVKLGKVRRLPAGSNKKFEVFVKNSKGNTVSVKFGDPGLEIKRDDPDRRNSFRARHKCDTDPKAKDRTRPKYWSCRQWRSGHKVES